MVDDIRKRRLIWLGHILRMEEGRLVRVAARVQREQGREGNLFSDTQEHLNFDDLVTLAKDREEWKDLVSNWLL